MLSALPVFSLDSIPFAALKVTDLARVMDLNQLAEELTGYRAKELVGENLTVLLTDCSLVTELSAQPTNKQQATMQQSIQLLSGIVVNLFNKHGDYLTCGLQILAAADGYIVCITQTDTNGNFSSPNPDITEPDRQIMPSEPFNENGSVCATCQSIAKVNHTANPAIFCIDEQDHIVYQHFFNQLNNEMPLLFDYLNMSVDDYLACKKTAKRQGQLQKYNKSFDNFNSVFDFSITYQADSTRYVWIVENVTDKYRKEQRHIITEKLSLLANTLDHVAHDFNNVLGLVLGAIEMLEIKSSQGNQDISTYISRIKNATDKGRDITERLAAFSQQPKAKLVEFDPIQEIRNNIHLFKKMLISSIDFDFKGKDVHCLIHFPQGEFIKILLNLVLNAQDSIRQHAFMGNIKMTADINIHDQLEIKLKDSGIASVQESLSQIFDPLFRCQSANDDNGLSLANTYNTLYRNHGQIVVTENNELGGALVVLLIDCSKVSKK